MSGRLADKVILLTGAAGGQGTAAIDAFAAEGATIVATDRVVQPEGAFARLVAEHDLDYRPCDLTDEGAVQRLVAATVADHGRIDGLYVNHGAVGPADFLDEQAELLERLWSVNVRSVFSVGQHVARVMVQQRGGSIVNVASSVALRAAPGLAAYSITKAAVLQLTRVMACELVTHGIRVNAICPGVIVSQMTMGPLAHLPEEQRAAAMAEMGMMAPMRRMGEPHEVVMLAVHLLSDESSYTTGAVFPVDGGISAAEQTAVR